MSIQSPLPDKLEKIFTVIKQMETDGVIDHYAIGGAVGSLRQITSRKLAWRRHLASLPVGEKLRMLEEMVQAAKTISATRPPKPPVALTSALLSQRKRNSA